MTPALYWELYEFYPEEHGTKIHYSAQNILLLIRVRTLMGYKSDPEPAIRHLNILIL